MRTDCLSLLSQLPTPHTMVMPSWVPLPPPAMASAVVSLAPSLPIWQTSDLVQIRALRKAVSVPIRHLGACVPFAVVRCMTRRPTSLTGHWVSGDASCPSARLSAMRKSPPRQQWSKTGCASMAASISWFRASAARVCSASVPASVTYAAVMPVWKHMVGCPVMGCVYTRGFRAWSRRSLRMDRRRHHASWSAGRPASSSVRATKRVAPCEGEGHCVAGGRRPGGK